MRVLDLFAGLGGWSTGFADLGHEVVTVDMDPSFGTDIVADVGELTPGDLPGPFDVVLASPPCERFSVLQIGRNWTPPPENAPKTPEAQMALDLVRHTAELTTRLDPAFFAVENPVAKLRRLVACGRIPTMARWERRTVTYCAYGAPWQKPTDVWGGFPPSFEARPRCSPKDPCHVGAARGSRTGVQGSREGRHPLVVEWERRCRERLESGLPHIQVEGGNMTAHKAAHRAAAGTSDAWSLSALRALVPHELSREFAEACERDLAVGATWRTPPSGRLFA